MSHHKSSGKKKNDAPKKPQLTHFLCIPLVNPTSRSQLESSIKKFRKDICSAASTGSVTEDLACFKSSGAEDTTAATEGTKENATPIKDQEQPTSPSQASLISQRAVRPVDTLHLTLGVMSLDKDKLAQATELLGTLDIPSLLHDFPEDPIEPSPEDTQSPPIQVSSPVSQPPSPREPMTLVLNSLTSMHSPSSTSILYLTPYDPTNRLYTLCTRLRSMFTEAGFLVPDSRPLKLHATVLNTIYAKSGRGRGNTGKSTKKAAVGKARDARNTGKAGNPSTMEGKAETEKEVKTEAIPSAEGVASTVDAKDARNPERKDTAAKTGHGPNAKAPLKLDAREILKKYEGFTWAEGVMVDRISICEMGAKKIFDEQGVVIGEKYAEVGFRTI